MKNISYIPSGVCSRQIDVVVSESGLIESVSFVGGCHGNTQGISKLVVGMTPLSVVEKLGGIDCKGKGTSCPDQLAKALMNSLK